MEDKSLGLAHPVQTNVNPMKTREEILADAIRLRDKAQQLLNHADHWNVHVRKARQPKINADPHGELRKIITDVNALLAQESKRTG